MATLLNKFKQQKREAENSLPSFDNGGVLSEDKINRIINKYSKGKSPLSAKDYIEVSKETGVPVEILLAQGVQESNFGTAGRAVRTKNVGNVGNVDSGGSRYMNSWREGLKVQANLLKKEYGVSSMKDVERLITKGFVRPKDGARYASDKNYEKRLSGLLKEINGSDFTAYSNNSNNNNEGSSEYDPSYENAVYNQYENMAKAYSVLAGAQVSAEDIEKRIKAENGLAGIQAELMMMEKDKEHQKEVAEANKLAEEALAKEQQEKVNKKAQEEQAIISAMEQQQKEREFHANAYLGTMKQDVKIDPAVFSSGGGEQQPFRFGTQMNLQNAQLGGVIQQAFEKPNLLKFKNKYDLK